MPKMAFDGRKSSQTFDRGGRALPPATRQRRPPEITIVVPPEPSRLTRS
jgi:hypothetical protein